MVEVSFEKLKSDFQVVHITGSGKTTNIKDPNYIQFEYIGEELKHIYAITNLVAGRAGANSLYELALMQKTGKSMAQLCEEVNDKVRGGAR